MLTTYRRRTFPIVLLEFRNVKGKECRNENSYNQVRFH